MSRLWTIPFHTEAQVGSEVCFLLYTEGVVVVVNCFSGSSRGSYINRTLSLSAHVDDLCINTEDSVLEAGSGFEFFSGGESEYVPAVVSGVAPTFIRRPVGSVINGCREQIVEILVQELFEC